MQMVAGMKESFITTKCMAKGNMVAGNKFPCFLLLTESNFCLNSGVFLSVMVLFMKVVLLEVRDMVMVF